MRFMVNGVTHHVGGVHDCLGPIDDIGAELEWVQQLSDYDALPVLVELGAVAIFARRGALQDGIDDVHDLAVLEVVAGRYVD
jgi:hypothetical protein